MAVAGFVLAFVFPLAGLICSIIGLKASKRLGGKFHGLALAGTIVSVVYLVISLLWLVAIILLIVIPALQGEARNTARLDDVDALKGQVETWVSDNGGSLPATQQDIDDIVGEVNWSYYGVFYGQPEAVAQSSALVPESAQEDTVVMFAAALPSSDAAATALPGSEAVHVWIGKSCGIVPEVNDDDLPAADTYDSYDLMLSADQAVAFVYQLEGPDSEDEENIRCTMLHIK